MDKIICFHLVDEPNGFLSNWYPSPFTLDGQHFTSVEQYMMYRKAITFGDTETAQAILSTDNVGKIKALAAPSWVTAIPSGTASARSWSTVPSWKNSARTRT